MSFALSLTIIMMMSITAPDIFSTEKCSRLSLSQKSKGLYEILRDVRTSTYQICRLEEIIIQTITFNKCICNWTLGDILKILWKRGEIAPILFYLYIFCSYFLFENLCP